MRRFSRYLWILALSLVCAPSYAEIPFTSLKARSELIQLKDEYQYLEPEIAFGSVRQGKFNNKLKFGDPKDPSVALIQTAFNSVSENPVFFNVSPLASGIGRFIGPSTSGEILRELNSAKSKKSFDLNTLKTTLSKKILEDEDFNTLKKEADSRRESLHRDIDQKYEVALRALDQEIHDLEKAHGQLKSQRSKKEHFELKPCLQAPDKNEKRIQDLKAQIDLLTEKIENRGKDLEQLKEKRAKLAADDEYKRLKNKLDGETFKEADLSAFIDKLLRAFLADQNHVPRPRHNTEQIILSLGWINGKKKADLIKLYSRIPEILKPSSIRNMDDAKKVAQWLKKSFNVEDFKREDGIVASLPPASRAKYLFENPEKAAFLAYGRAYFDPSHVPLIPYTTTEYTHPETKKVTRFADCMDSSVLNFLAIALASSKGFNLRLLKENLNKLGSEIGEVSSTV